MKGGGSNTKVNQNRHWYTVYLKYIFGDFLVQQILLPNL